MGSSPGFLGNPFGSMPRARDSGDPGATSHYRSSGAAFRLVNGVGIATSRVFGAESSRPASLLCTLRTHQSPGEWQHSLPACLLDSDRAGLTPAGFHQEVSPFHLRFLLFQTFPSAMTMSAVSSDLGFHFSKSVHTFPSAQTHWFLQESNGLYFSMICIQPHGSARFLQHAESPVRGFCPGQLPSHPQAHAESWDAVRVKHAAHRTLQPHEFS